MPTSPGFRTRTLALLDSSRDDDTVVVAVSTPEGARRDFLEAAGLLVLQRLGIPAACVSLEDDNA